MTSVMQRTDGVAAVPLTEIVRQVASRVPAGDDWQRSTTIRARYAGQGHELDVPLPADADFARCGLEFEHAHERLFGYRLDRPIEIVSLRQSVSGNEREIRLERSGKALVWDELQPADGGGPLSRVVTGPVSVALPDATLHVAPGWTARALDIGGWMLERTA
jgi:N-methylhydantoinase A